MDNFTPEAVHSSELVASEAARFAPLHRVTHSRAGFPLNRTTRAQFSLMSVAFRIGGGGISSLAPDGLARSRS